MTDRDERLGAVAKASRDLGGPFSKVDHYQIAERFIAMRDADDAIRAFDEQRRKPTPMDPLGDSSMRGPDEPQAGYCYDCPTYDQCSQLGCIKTRRQRAPAPAATPVGADPLRDEIAARYGADKVVALETLMTPPVGADPPWLDEAAKIASDCYFGSAHCEGWPEVVRAVLTFAAAKAPSDSVLADPPWLDKYDLNRLQMARDHDTAMIGKKLDGAQVDRRCLLAIIDKMISATAQPPSEAEIEAAYQVIKATGLSYHREVLIRVLLAAAKARAGG